MQGLNFEDVETVNAHVSKVSIKLYSKLTHLILHLKSKIVVVQKISKTTVPDIPEV